MELATNSQYFFFLNLSILGTQAKMWYQLLLQGLVLYAEFSTYLLVPVLELPAAFIYSFIFNSVVCRLPLYYELKIAFVVWLLSPYTRGASLIYRKFLHPLLSSKERVWKFINIIHLPELNLLFKMFLTDTLNRNIFLQILITLTHLDCVCNKSVCGFCDFGFRRLMNTLCKPKNEVMRPWWILGGKV